MHVDKLIFPGRIDSSIRTPKHAGLGTSNSNRHSRIQNRPSPKHPQTQRSGQSPARSQGINRIDTEPRTKLMTNGSSNRDRKKRENKKSNNNKSNGKSVGGDASSQSELSELSRAGNRIDDQYRSDSGFGMSRSGSHYHNIQIIL